MFHPVSASRGCPFHCEFCSVYAFDGQKSAAVKTLERAIRNGLPHTERVEEDEAFDDLRLLPEFEETLKAPQR